MAVTAIVAIVASFIAIYTCTSLWQSPSPPPPPPSAPDLPTLLERSTALALGGASLVIAFVGAGARCSSGMWGAGCTLREMALPREDSPAGEKRRRSSCGGARLRASPDLPSEAEEDRCFLGNCLPV